MRLQSDTPTLPRGVQDRGPWLATASPADASNGLAVPTPR